MSQEDYPVEFVLDSIESIMPPSNQPKVLLFDIGGVCVVSPFQAILDHEISHGIPPGWINHAIAAKSPNGSWHHLERGEVKIDPVFMRDFTADLTNAELWPKFYARAAEKDSSLPKIVPPVPDVNGEEVFWKMMHKSRAWDPWMHPALQKLKDSGKYVMAALSNTVIFPDDHEYAHPKEENDVRRFFDVFVSSAHVGLRKPDPKIYELTLKMVNEYVESQRSTERARKFWWGGEDGKKVEAGDVVFFDDIGENLKAGKKAGFRTAKVNLGKTFEAVDALEDVTGMSLAGEHPRVPVLPVMKRKAQSGAKL